MMIIKKWINYNLKFKDNLNKNQNKENNNIKQKINLKILVFHYLNLKVV